MARFKKRPVEVEAWQFTPANWAHIGPQIGAGRVADGKPEMRYMEPAEFTPTDYGADIRPKLVVAIPTLEGVMVASEGDWIIRGVKGELYPCKPDIFALTYEEA